MLPAGNTLCMNARGFLLKNYIYTIIVCPTEFLSKFMYNSERMAFN